MSAHQSASIDGTCSPDFYRVRDAFEANFRQRDEIGASVAAWLDGQLVFGSAARIRGFDPASTRGTTIFPGPPAILKTAALPPPEADTINDDSLRARLHDRIPLLLPAP